jgi:methyl-accepting chemotaxis protein
LPWPNSGGFSMIFGPRQKQQLQHWPRQRRLFLNCGTILASSLPVFGIRATQKAIDAAIQTAAVFNGTGRLINTRLIPQAMKMLDGLTESTASLNRMIQATDNSVNAGIAPEAVRSLQSSGEALKQLSTALQEVSGRANASLDDIHSILSDPAWATSLDSIQSATQNVSGITTELEKASQEMPEITKSINQIASTSNRYRPPRRGTLHSTANY